MRALIIEDDADLRLALKTCLENVNFNVDIAETGPKGSLLGRTKDYDVILLDLLLPERTGNSVCTEIRMSGKSTPIIAMSVQSEVPQKIKLLDLGADDYVIKPFSLDELVARISAVTRRPQTIKSDILQIGSFKLDIMSQQFFIQDKEVYLTRKEFALLEYLMRHQGMVVTRHMLLENVWDDALDGVTNTIETHIRSLRKKIGRKNGSKIIVTVPGRGYSFRSS